MKFPVSFSLGSRRLEDGRGGIFINDELVHTFATEAESDSACIAIARCMVADGVATPIGTAYKDDEPMDLFDMSIN